MGINNRIKACATTITHERFAAVTASDGLGLRVLSRVSKVNLGI